MNDTVTIIFRATDFRFGVHAKNRFFSTNKTDISKTCFISLYNSLKEYKDRVKFIVLGDRLSVDLKTFFKSYDIELVEHTGGSKSGLRDNIQKALDIAYSVDTDWIWIQEDDYLFIEEAGNKIFDLIDNKQKIFKGHDKNLVIYPADYSDRYTRHKDRNKKYHLFLGENNYWREIHNTTFSWCIKKSHLNRASKMFDQMFRDIKYKAFDTFLSNNIWSNNCLVVSPIPSLSAHLDGHISLPPCIDWKNIWNKNVNL